MLQGIHARYQLPSGDTLFEATYFKLFKRELLREVIAEIPSPLEAVVVYRVWEEEAVLKSNAIPLTLSEWVYNYAPIHEYTALGREGLPIPKQETRKSYRALVGGFLNFCRDRMEPWSNSENISTCWVAFLKASTVGEQDARLALVGHFVQHCVSGRVFGLLTTSWTSIRIAAIEATSLRSYLSLSPSGDNEVGCRHRSRC
jgi:hypothetical protein